jgi:hypothetical protein
MSTLNDDWAAPACLFSLACATLHYHGNAFFWSSPAMKKTPAGRFPKERSTGDL